MFIFCPNLPEKQFIKTIICTFFEFWPKTKNNKLFCENSNKKRISLTDGQ